MKNRLDAIFSDRCCELSEKHNINTNAYYYILPETEIAQPSINALKLVKFKNFVQGIDSYEMIDGSVFVFDEANHQKEITIRGIIIYMAVEQSTAIYTSEGIKIRVSSSDETGQVLYTFQKPENIQGKYLIKYIFRISENVMIALNPAGDALFDTVEDANKYTQSLRYYGGELNSEGIKIILNKKCIHYKNFDMFYKGKPYDCKNCEKLFEMLCYSYPVKGKSNYERTFFLHPGWFEYVLI